MMNDGTVDISWTYVVEHAAVRKGDRMYFRDYVVPQAMLKTPTLDLTVVAPDGWRAQPGHGWTGTRNGVATSVPMDHLQVLKVLLTKK